MHVSLNSSVNDLTIYITLQSLQSGILASDELANDIRAIWGDSSSVGRVGCLMSGRSAVQIPAPAYCVLGPSFCVHESVSEWFLTKCFEHLEHWKIAIYKQRPFVIC